jgi:hypothetical protein
MSQTEQSACPRCGVPGETHTDVTDCADALIAYYAAETGRCSCGAPEPCVAPRFGGQHVPPSTWLAWEAGQEDRRS